MRSIAMISAVLAACAFPKARSAPAHYVAYGVDALAILVGAEGASLDFGGGGEGGILVAGFGVLGTLVNATIDDDTEARDDQLADVSEWTEHAAARGDCATVRRNARALATIDRATYDRLTGEPAIVACLAP